MTNRSIIPPYPSQVEGQGLESLPCDPRAARNCEGCGRACPLAAYVALGLAVSKEPEAAPANKGMV